MAEDYIFDPAPYKIKMLGGYLCTGREWDYAKFKEEKTAKEFRKWCKNKGYETKIVKPLTWDIDYRYTVWFR